MAQNAKDVTYWNASYNLGSKQCVDQIICQMPKGAGLSHPNLLYRIILDTVQTQKLCSCGMYMCLCGVKTAKGCFAKVAMHALRCKNRCNHTEKRNEMSSGEGAS